MLLNRPRATAVMDKYGLDGLIAVSPINVHYLSDYWGPYMSMRRGFYNYAVLPRREDAPAALVLSAVELTRLHESPELTWMPNRCAYSHPSFLSRRDHDPDTEEPQAVQIGFKWPVREEALTADDKAYLDFVQSYNGSYSVNSTYALRKALKDAGLDHAKVGTDDPRIIPWMNDIGLPKLTGVEATPIFREIRMVKSEPELALLRRAAAINENAVNATIASLHVGQPQEELETVYATELAKQGGKIVYMATGSKGKRKGVVEKDQLITFDGLCEYRHYHGDIGRTAICGTPTQEMLDRNKAMKVGCEIAYGMIRPGVTGRAVTQAVIDGMKKAGFPGYLIATPHSLGLEHTDHPLPMGLQLPGHHGLQVFEENMVFTIDMPYTEVGWGNLHVEDTVRVTKDGVEPFNSLDIGLRVVPA